MPKTNELAADTTARAARSAVWIAIVLAEQAHWPDIVERLYELHATVDARVRQAERP